MAISAITPRDRLTRLVDLGRKTLRYWWLVAVFAVVGGAVSLVFAVKRPKSFQSEAVLSYDEKIKQSVLTNRQQEVDRNIGERYRELLLARVQLAKVIADPKLNAFAKEKDPELAIDRLRQAIKFTAPGGNTFHILYTDSDPVRAQAVTAKLTELLREKDDAMRNESAQATVQFALQQKNDAIAELQKRQQALAEFLAAHPEFAADPNQGNAGGEGAAVRLVHTKNAATATNTNSRLYALERQRQRLQARLDAPPDAPPIHIPAPQSPEKIAAEAQVTDAERELKAAQRDLDDALSKYTDKHPTVVNAQKRVADSQAKLRHAQAAADAVPSADTEVAPATPADRSKLQKQLNDIESQIADEQKRSGGKGDTAQVDKTTNWVVKLETTHADLRRAVAEQGVSVDYLSESARRAQMNANERRDDQAGGLSVVDPANKPVRPSGPGKTIFLLAGMILFLALGSGLAVGMAVIDDRLYRRADIDQLGVAVLAVIPPPLKAAKHGHRPRKEVVRKEAA
jgi:capsular polysaccharide biosynthesis protein